MNHDHSRHPKTNGPSVRAGLVRALQDAKQADVAWELGRCSTRPLRNAPVTVYQRPDEGRHAIGLNRCKRVPCPICGPYLIRRRANELQEVAIGLQGKGDLIHFFVTFSVRHHIGTSWRTSANGLGEMRRATRNLRGWRKLVIGSFRFLESTYGRHGHHLHEHALITIRPSGDWDPKAFFEKVEEACHRAARSAGLSCSFSPGWWVAIPSQDLPRAVAYCASAQKWGQAGAHPREGHKALWEMEPAAYAEVWQESKHVRWFDASGCWKPHPSTDQDDPHEAQPPRAQEALLFQIPAEIWKAWSPQERRERLTLIYDPRVTTQELLRIAMDWGAQLWPPSPAESPDLSPIPRSPA